MVAISGCNISVSWTAEVIIAIGFKRSLGRNKALQHYAFISRLKDSLCRLYSFVVNCHEYICT